MSTLSDIFGSYDLTGTGVTIGDGIRCDYSAIFDGTGCVASSGPVSELDNTNQLTIILRFKITQFVRSTAILAQYGEGNIFTHTGNGWVITVTNSKIEFRFFGGDSIYLSTVIATNKEYNLVITKNADYISIRLASISTYTTPFTSASTPSITTSSRVLSLGGSLHTYNAVHPFGGPVGGGGGGGGITEFYPFLYGSIENVHIFNKCLHGSEIEPLIYMCPGDYTSIDNIKSILSDAVVWYDGSFTIERGSTTPIEVTARGYYNTFSYSQYNPPETSGKDVVSYTEKNDNGNGYIYCNATISYGSHVVQSPNYDSNQSYRIFPTNNEVQFNSSDIKWGALVVFNVPDNITSYEFTPFEIRHYSEDLNSHDFKSSDPVIYPVISNNSISAYMRWSGFVYEMIDTTASITKADDDIRRNSLYSTYILGYGMDLIYDAGGIQHGEENLDTYLSLVFNCTFYGMSVDSTGEYFYPYSNPYPPYVYVAEYTNYAKYPGPEYLYSISYEGGSVFTGLAYNNTMYADFKISESTEYNEITITSFVKQIQCPINDNKYQVIFGTASNLYSKSGYGFVVGLKNNKFFIYIGDYKKDLDIGLYNIDWSHVAFTYSKSNNRIRLYLNGYKIFEDIFNITTHVLPDIHNNYYKLCLGCCANYDRDLIKGIVISKLNIFGDELSEDRVYKLFKYEYAGTTIIKYEFLLNRLKTNDGTNGFLEDLNKTYIDRKSPLSKNCTITSIGLRSTSSFSGTLKLLKVKDGLLSIIYSIDIEHEGDATTDVVFNYYDISPVVVDNDEIYIGVYLKSGKVSCLSEYDSTHPIVFSDTTFNILNNSYIEGLYVLDGELNEDISIPDSKINSSIQACWKYFLTPIISDKKVLYSVDSNFTVIDEVGEVTASAYNCKIEEMGLLYNSISLNGVNSSIVSNLTKSLVFDTGYTFSVSLFFKTEKRLEQQLIYIGSPTDEVDSVMRVFIKSGEDILTIKMFGSDDLVFRVESISITDGVWHHLVITHSAALNMLNIYVDGFASTSREINIDRFSHSSEYTMVLGCNTISNSMHFSGLFDLVKVFYKYIDIDDVRILYNERYSGTLKTTSPIISVDFDLTNTDRDIIDNTNNGFILSMDRNYTKAIKRLLDGRGCVTFYNDPSINYLNKTAVSLKSMVPTSFDIGDNGAYTWHFDQSPIYSLKSILDVNSDFSISFMFNISEFNNNTSTLFEILGCPAEYLPWSSSVYFRVLIYGSSIYSMTHGGTQSVMSKNVSLRTNRWYHLTIAHYGKYNSFELYLDGDLIGSMYNKLDEKFYYRYLYEKIISIGGSSISQTANSQSVFLGSISSLKIYNTLLSKSAIKSEFILNKDILLVGDYNVVERALYDNVHVSSLFTSYKSTINTPSFAILSYDNGRLDVNYNGLKYTSYTTENITSNIDSGVLNYVTLCNNAISLKDNSGIKFYETCFFPSSLSSSSIDSLEEYIKSKYKITSNILPSIYFDFEYIKSDLYYVDNISGNTLKVNSPSYIKENFDTLHGSKCARLLPNLKMSLERNDIIKSNNFTYSFWIKPLSCVGSNNVILKFGNDLNYSGYEMVLSSSTNCTNDLKPFNIKFVSYNSSSSNILLSCDISKSLLYVGEWAQVSIVVNNDKQYISLYINGIMQSFDKDVYAFKSIEYKYNDILYFYCPSLSSMLLDEFKFYNKALSLLDIENIYTLSGRSVPFMLDSSDVYYCSMDLVDNGELKDDFNISTFTLTGSVHPTERLSNSYIFPDNEGNAILLYDVDSSIYSNTNIPKINSMLEGLEFTILLYLRVFSVDKLTNDINVFVSYSSNDTTGITLGYNKLSNCIFFNIFIDGVKYTKEIHLIGKSLCSSFFEQLHPFNCIIKFSKDESIKMYKIRIFINYEVVGSLFIKYDGDGIITLDTENDRLSFLSFEGNINSTPAVIDEFIIIPYSLSNSIIENRLNNLDEEYSSLIKLNSDADYTDVIALLKNEAAFYLDTSELTTLQDNQDMYNVSNVVDQKGSRIMFRDGVKFHKNVFKSIGGFSYNSSDYGYGIYVALMNTLVWKDNRIFGYFHEEAFTFLTIGYFNNSPTLGTISLSLRSDTDANIQMIGLQTNPTIPLALMTSASHIESYSTSPVLLLNWAGIPYKGVS